MQGDASQNALPDSPETIDAAVMTHGHLDHTGMIPALVEKGFRGPVFGQYATCEIAGIIWEDGLRIAKNSCFDTQITGAERESVTQAKKTCPLISGD